MSTTIALDIPAFRARFAPTFDSTVNYPDPKITLYWADATAYISNQNGGAFCGALTLQQQTLALNYMTAHLLALQDLIVANPGGVPGLEQSATIDKISVSLTPPPLKNQWQWWLSLTPYGQQLLSLLAVRGVGGFFFGARPEIGNMRRGGGY